MKRILELIDQINLRYPENDFFMDFREVIATTISARSQYEEIDNCLMDLDQPSWNLLKEKAISKFMSHRIGNWEQDFFNTLNESKAYSFLVHNSCTGLSFIKESDHTTRTPDIEGIFDRRQLLCEVKTINKSDDEIIRYMSNEFHTSYFLNDGFFNKLDSAILQATDQLNQFKKDSNSILIIYLDLNFDDFSVKYSSTYHDEINGYLLQKANPLPIFIHNWDYSRRSLYNCLGLE
jgi:hypothetical protein